MNGRSLEAGKRHRFAQGYQRMRASVMCAGWVGCVPELWCSGDCPGVQGGLEVCNLEIHPQNDETTDAVSHMHAVVSELKRARS